MISDLICIKEVYIIGSSHVENNYKNFFKIGNKYKFELRNSTYFMLKERYLFSEEEIKEFFLTLDKWREQRINKLLENDI